jgi:hypothetical protein
MKVGKITMIFVIFFIFLEVDLKAYSLYPFINLEPKIKNKRQ